jgi:hypothetical protein
MQGTEREVRGKIAGDRAVRVVLAFACALILQAAQSTMAAQTFPVHVVGTLIVTRCVLHSARGDLPANLIVDLGAQQPLELISSQADMVGLQAADPALDVVLASDSTAAAPRVHVTSIALPARIPSAQEINDRFASELDQIPITGVLGLGAFPGQLLEVDLARGVIRFGPSGDDAPAGVSFEFAPAGLLLESSSVRTALATRQFATLAAARIFDEYHIGQADAHPILAAGVDVSRLSALRAFAPPAGAASLVLGVQFVSGVRLFIDTSTRRLHIQPNDNPPPVAAEQSVLLALKDNKLDAIQDFLNAHPDSPLAPEISFELLRKRLADPNTPPPAMTASIKSYAQAIPIGQRSGELLKLADALLKAKNPRVSGAIATCLDLSSNWTSDDIDGTAIHELNARRGLVALQNGDVKQARRYLLSASFGLPKDPLVHLWLGQVYQKTHQLQRAWAQFTEASLAQDPPIDAIIELAAVMRDPSFRAGFGAADAELILEGRVPSFWPDESRQPDQRPAVQLVEFFSDANNSRTVGGQLAFDGLREFFTGTPVVFICYHLEAQLINDTCRERAKFYGVRKSGVLVADGAVVSDQSGTVPATSKLYQQYLPHLLGGPDSSLPRSVELHVDARIRSRTVSADVGVAMPLVPGSEPRLYVLLCERCVMSATQSGVPLQYCVVRGQFTPAGGFPLSSARQTFQGVADLDPLPDDLSFDSHRSPLTADYLDEREMQVVAFVQDAKSQKVLGAVMVQPAQEGRHP